MRLIRKIGFPFSLLYGLVVRIRNLLFDVGLFKSVSFKTPTICIGNLSVGGTGKTPMAEFLISLLQDDHRLAFLSRGYRRNSSGYQLANAQSTVGQLGDEPYQIHSKFPKIAVAVDADRRNGIRLLEEAISPDIILLDDAFQHRRVEYGLSILLTAYGHLYVDDHYLPTGDLRDSKREARRADIIIVTKCPPGLTKSECESIRHKLQPEAHQEVLFSYLDYAKILKGSQVGEGIQGFNGNTSPDVFQESKKNQGRNAYQGSEGDKDSHRNEGAKQNLKQKVTSSGLSLDNLSNKKITLVTGIADPSPLVAHLKESGLIFEHLRFKDHHAFTAKELASLSQKEVILTTEKDYMRLKGKLENLYYLGIEHRFIADGKKRLEGQIVKFLKTNSSG